MEEDVDFELVFLFIGVYSFGLEDELEEKLLFLMDS